MGRRFGAEAEYVSTNYSGLCQFSFLSPPFLFKAEGTSETPFVSANYISAVIVPNESPVCGSFQQRIVTGLVNWSWLDSA